MTDPSKPQPAPAPSQPAASKKLRTFAEFLEVAPPDFAEEVSDRTVMSKTGAGPYLSEPEIQLYCESEKCGGVRTYYCTTANNYLEDKINYKYLTYVCRNCRLIATSKTFALAVKGNAKNGLVQN